MSGKTLSYSIIGGADASKFTIGATTGALSFITAPNFELPTDAGGNNVYDVIVQVSDGHGGIDTQAIAVTVTDVFENTAPIITSNGGGNTAAVSIAENTTAVTTVTATDPDVGQTLSYSISGGADASKFTIGASTGALSFVTAPNFELPTDAGGNNVYDVIVQASDGHGGIDTSGYRGYGSKCRGGRHQWRQRQIQLQFQVNRCHGQLLGQSRDRRWAERQPHGADWR